RRAARRARDRAPWRETGRTTPPPCRWRVRGEGSPLFPLMRHLRPITGSQREPRLAARLLARRILYTDSRSVSAGEAPSTLCEESQALSERSARPASGP